MNSEKPWTVFLMANVADDPITQCEIEVHQFPDEYVYHRNQLEAPFNQRWVILMRLRYFPHKEAQANALYWLNKTRGTQRYIAKGFYLARQLMIEKYGQEYTFHHINLKKENVESIVPLHEMPLSLDIIPYSKQEYLNIMNVLYSRHTLWPTCSLEQILDDYCKDPCSFVPHVLSESRTFMNQTKITQLPRILQKNKSLADFVRMVDLHDNSISTISPTLLRRFVTVFSETLAY